MKRLATWSICTLILSLAACIPGAAQTITGAVRGVITDPTGAIVPGAKVIATNIATGVKTESVTDQAGEYSIRFLQIGQYKLTVESSGFQTASYGPFALEIDQVAKVDIPLSVGQANTTVTVSEQYQPILQTESPTNGETFTENTINSVPLNGRDFSQLTAFTPGAVSTGYGSYGNISGGTSNSSERSTNDSNESNVNGSRQQSNNFLLDGQEINENINNTIGYSPSPDSLEQIRVIASNANAEFGNVNGGEVVMVMKSGSNSLHGSAFGFLQNYNLDANSWANNNNPTPLAKNPYNQTIFGGTLGGPILKDKLFFFINYEAFREHQGGVTNFSVAPPAFFQGNLSALESLGIQLYDTQNLLPNGQPTPYPNDVIPASQITNPVALFLAAHPDAYPAPNNPTSDSSGIYNNFVGPSGSYARNDQGDVKIDWHLHDKDVISGRYSQGYAENATTTDPVPVQFPTASNYPDHLGVFNWTRSFSPSIVNNATAAFARIQFNSGVSTDPSGIFGFKGNSLVGIPSKPQLTQGFSEQTFSTNGTTGYPSNFGANPTPEVFVDNVFQYGDDLTWERGRHIFKFGAEITRYQQNSFYPGNDGELGNFTYNGAYTGGYPFADFLLDRVNDVQIGDVSGLTGQRQYRDGFFAQDDWKVTSNLTLNLGVRWEYDQPIYEVNNKMANLNLTTAQIEYAGVNGASRALYNADYGQVQPRFGFAYQPNQRWVIRGGYGITSYLEGMGANLRLTQNPPFHTDFEEQGQSPIISGGVVQSKGNYYLASNGFPTTTPPTTTFYAWPNDLKPSSTQEMTLVAEYEVTPTSSFQVGYVGILGHHLTDPYWGNQRPSPNVLGPYDNIVGTYISNGQSIGDATPAANLVKTGVVKISATNAASNYNALQAVFRQRLTGGLELTANYTYAKALTDSFGYYGVSNISGEYYQQNAYDMRSEWGPAGFDIRQALSVSGVYDLPFGRGKMFGGNMNRVLDEAVGGWKLAGTNVTYTAFPLTAGSTSYYSSQVYSATARPEQFQTLHVRGRTLDHWFGTSAGVLDVCKTGTNDGTCVFGEQPSTTFGNVHPMSLRGPGYEQIDMSLAKTFPVWKEHRLDFRADAFNTFNIASYSAPNNNVSSSSFGQIVAPSGGTGTPTTSASRHIQLSLKYAF